MEFNPFKKKTVIENNNNNEPKEVISENAKKFKEKFSSIKFPADFEVKMTTNFGENQPMHFYVEKMVHLIK